MTKYSPPSSLPLKPKTKAIWKHCRIVLYRTGTSLIVHCTVAGSYVRIHFNWEGPPTFEGGRKPGIAAPHWRYSWTGTSSSRWQEFWTAWTLTNCTSDLSLEIQLNRDIFLTLAGVLNSLNMTEYTSVPEFIDPVFTKTSPKRSFSLIQNERFGLVFAKTGSIISGTDLSLEIQVNRDIFIIF